MANINNLKPFTGVNDSRRQNGRKKGSKNIANITRSLLDSEVNLKLPINKDICDYISNNGNISYMKAITLAMIIKAINGDVRAATWVADRYDKLPDSTSVFEKPALIFEVVPNKKESL